MGERNRFDVGEIEFVADNMDYHTRSYVEATQRAALRRSKWKHWPQDARERMNVLADRMGAALKNKPNGYFDSCVRGDND